MVLHIRQLRTERVEVHVTEKQGIGIRLVDAGMLIPHASSDMHTFNIKLREKSGNWNWLLVLRQKAELCRNGGECSFSCKQTQSLVPKLVVNI